MDLQTMLYNLIPSSLYRGAAQSRVTRTPIIQGDLGPGVSGDYVPPNSDSHMSLMDMAKLMAAQLPTNKGVITYNPAMPDTAGTIRHEDIHAALQPVSDKLPGLQEGPYGPLVQKMVSGYRVGDPNIEAPAYMGAYSEKETGVPPEIRDMYLKSFQDPSHLGQYPTISRQYDRLAHPTAVNATAAAGENGGSQ